MSTPRYSVWSIESGTCPCIVLDQVSYFAVLKENSKDQYLTALIYVKSRLKHACIAI